MFDSRAKPADLTETPSVTVGSSPGSTRTRTGGGKVVHDARGNAIWQWGVATGVFAAIKSTELLSMLENPTLSLEGELRVGAGEWAGDPYNRR
jgi:hypothetical protein